MSTIQQLTTHDSLPQQSLTTAEITYTENGHIKALLTSPVIDQYTNTTLKDNQQVMYGDSLSLTEDMNHLELKQIRATLDYKEKL